MFDNYKEINFKTITCCSACGAESIKTIIDLPELPVTGVYVDRKLTDRMGFADQGICLCDICGHVQLKNLVDSKVIYGKDYYTRTSLSASACEANDVFYNFIKSIIGNEKLRSAIEIGCNDQYLLKKLCDQFENLYGIDPILEKKKTHNIHLINDFIENCSDSICDSADLIISSHTIEHLENPFEVLKILIDKAPFGTVFCHQLPCFDALVENSHFDQVFHQHFNYFSQHSLVFMLNKLGVQIIDMQHNPYHWGAILVAYKKVHSFNNGSFLSNAFKFGCDSIKDSFDIFKNLMDVVRRQLESTMGPKIYGYGAAQMLPLLDYHLGGLQMLECIIDDDPSKNGLFYLNVPLEVRSSSRCADYVNSVILVTAINSMIPLRSITQRLTHEKVKKIILPLNIL